MNIHLANLSTDLRRISNWIYNGNLVLARDNIRRIKARYKDIVAVGVYNNIWEEIDKIEKNEEGNIKSSDRATTLGSILIQEALKL